MQIDLLCDHPEHIEQVATWCFNEWPWYYQGKFELARDEIKKSLNPNRVPCTFIALKDNILCGTAGIILDDMDIRPNYNPWLGSLYIDPNFRRQGIARKLLERRVEHAKFLKLDTIYVWTAKLGDLFTSENWEFLEKVIYQGLEVQIFKKNL